jgi:hypothetical protein
MVWCKACRHNVEHVLPSWSSGYGADLSPVEWGAGCVALRQDSGLAFPLFGLSSGFPLLPRVEQCFLQLTIPRRFSFSRGFTSGKLGLQRRFACRAFRLFLGCPLCHFLSPPRLLGCPTLRNADLAGSNNRLADGLVTAAWLRGSRAR